LQSKVIERVDILKHKLTLATLSIAVLPTADEPTALDWVVTKPHKEKKLKALMTDNLIKLVSLSKSAIREHQKASVGEATLAQKAGDLVARLLITRWLC
jgi:hypothetical protein